MALLTHLCVRSFYKKDFREVEDRITFTLFKCHQQNFIVLKYQNVFYLLSCKLFLLFFFVLGFFLGNDIYMTSLKNFQLGCVTFT